MAGTAKRSDPALWEKVKAEVTRGDKGGEAGEWSARKAQMAVQQYKKAGGGYQGGKTEDNHLSQWTREEWGTKSGKDSGDTGERYLPKKAREKLTDAEYDRTTAKKRRDTKAGKQFSAQPEDVAAKVTTARERAAGEDSGKMSGASSGAGRKLGSAAKPPARGTSAANKGRSGASDETSSPRGGAAASRSAGSSKGGSR